jgi:alpha-beta hydrolase superfamily lysophospholipase
MVRQSGGLKVVIVAHSMGGNYMLYFFQWVTVHRHVMWVHEHVHAMLKVAVPALGVPKSVTALLSGEARDTAELGMLGALLDHHLNIYNTHTHTHTHTHTQTHHTICVCNIFI